MLHEMKIIKLQTFLKPPPFDPSVAFEQMFIAFFQICLLAAFDLPQTP